MNPDDDHLYASDNRPRQWDGIERRHRRMDVAANCDQHAENTTSIGVLNKVVETLNVKLNLVLVGVSVAVSAMAALLFMQIESGKMVSANIEQIRQNTTDIDMLQKHNIKVDEEMAGLFRWRERWETKENFVHGTNEEKHHLEGIK
jgi:hypothetical protein